MFLRKPKGFTLIELMVAMVVGLLVAGVAMAMYVSLIRANSTSIQAALVLPKHCRPAWM